MRRPAIRSLALGSSAIRSLARAIPPFIAFAASAQTVGPMHPRFPLLDATGKNVLETHGPISTMQTCGDCHDTIYITSHSYHTKVGLEDAGAKNVGGLFASEMNCFLCHLAEPDNGARIAELRAGRGDWAITATLARTGLVDNVDGRWVWNHAALSNERSAAKRLLPRPPTSTHCGQCHGVVHKGPEPLVAIMGADNAATEVTGQVFSDQRMSRSGMNLAGKDSLSRPWDVHAERLLECTSCHNSINNPAHFAGADGTKPDHLSFEPRRLSVGEFLLRPSHDFAKGNTPQSKVAHNLDGSMRRCESCHDVGAAHQWLPYEARHFQALSCESCHVPQAVAPAQQMVDQTILTAAGLPVVTYRGVDGRVNDPAALVSGFRPVLISRTDPAGPAKLLPHNLVTTYSWMAGDPAQVVVPLQLREAILDGDSFYPDIVAALDTNKDGTIQPGELRLDTDAKISVVAARLQALGLESPHIVGVIQPYSLHHGVVSGEWATRECTACHSRDSRTTDSLILSTYQPGGVQPQVVEGVNAHLDGRMWVDDDGALMYTPVPTASGRYVIGQDRWLLGDVLGGAAIALVLLGVSAHAIMLFLSRKGAAR